MRIAHGVEVAGAGLIVSGTVAKCGAGGNGREKNWCAGGGDFADQAFAEKIAGGAGLQKAVERQRCFAGGDGEIFAKLRTEKIFLAGHGVTEKMRNHRAKEIPP